MAWQASRHCRIAAQRPKNPRKLQGFGGPQCRRAEFTSASREESNQ
jgi:hypothetical protein